MAVMAKYAEDIEERIYNNRLMNSPQNRLAHTCIAVTDTNKVKHTMYY